MITQIEARLNRAEANAAHMTVYFLSLAFPFKELVVVAFEVGLDIGSNHNLFGFWITDVRQAPEEILNLLRRARNADSHRAAPGSNSHSSGRIAGMISDTGSPVVGSFLTHGNACRRESNI